MPAKPTPKKPPVPKQPKKPEFSPTRLRSFLSCPMMYRLDYVDKVGRFYHRARAGFTFGSTLHQALQTFHQDGGTAAVSAPELVAMMETVWQSQGYESAAHEAEYKVEAVRILEVYHAASEARAEETRPFLIEKMLKWDMGPFVLTGRIDRIDEHLSDGALEIVDYKSGRMSVTEADVKSALAMSICCIFLRKRKNKIQIYLIIWF